MNSENSFILTRMLTTFSLTLSDYSKMMKLRLRTKDSVIELPFRVANIDNVHIGKNVWIGKDAWFNLRKECHLYIGDGTQIGRYSIFSGQSSYIWIGKNVLIGPRVYLSSSRHEYEDVTKPVMKQGSVPKGNVRIEDDSWLGLGVCVLPNVTIGKHSVIGVNAVVSNDIPSYSVAVGNPAKVVKKYDFERNQWVRVGPNNSRKLELEME